MGERDRQRGEDGKRSCAQPCPAIEYDEQRSAYLDDDVAMLKSQAGSSPKCTISPTPALKSISLARLLDQNMKVSTIRATYPNQPEPSMVWMICGIVSPLPSLAARI